MYAVSTGKAEVTKRSDGTSSVKYSGHDRKVTVIARSQFLAPKLTDLYRAPSMSTNEWSRSNQFTEM